MAGKTLTSGLGPMLATFARAVVSTHFLSKGDFTLAEIVTETAQRCSQSPDSVSQLSSQVIDLFTHLATANPPFSIQDFCRCDSQTESTLLSVWSELGTEVRRAVIALRQWNPTARSCAWTVDVQMLGRRTEMLNEPECTVRLLAGDSTIQFSTDKSSLDSLVLQLEEVEARVKSLVFKA